MNTLENNFSDIPSTKEAGRLTNLVNRLEQCTTEHQQFINMINNSLNRVESRPPNKSLDEKETKQKEPNCILDAMEISISTLNKQLSMLNDIVGHLDHIV